MRVLLASWRTAPGLRQLGSVAPGYDYPQSAFRFRLMRVMRLASLISKSRYRIVRNGPDDKIEHKRMRVVTHEKPATDADQRADITSSGSNVWEYPGISTMRAGRLEELAMHPTVKPVALVADAIKDCSRRGGVVLLEDAQPGEFDLLDGVGRFLLTQEDRGEPGVQAHVPPTLLQQLPRLRTKGILRG